jgi:deazaflavin-dependent oxidoreductase (nitroreductase family)
MTSHFEKFEQKLFRSLNSVVEPAVRRGFGSPTLAPASLIVLETTGFKSGEQRRTPLWSVRLGRYRIVSTARGKRSFWVKNMQQQPKVSYYLGGRRRDSDAVVIAEGMAPEKTDILNPFMQKLAVIFSRYAHQGWAFAILVPATR